MVLGRTYQPQPAPAGYQPHVHAITEGAAAVVTHSVVRMAPVTSESGSLSDHSETSSSGDDKSELKHDDICRDYLRNVCKRGKRCKYRHPAATEAKELGRQHEYTFCHDYQNSGCRRHNCRFLHCTRDEEDYHKQTGQLPVRLQQAAALGIGVMPNELPLLKGEVPVCKDFLKGQCMRAGRCKYRHVTPGQYEVEAVATPSKEQRPRNPEGFEIFNKDDAERYTSDYDASTATPAIVTIATKRRRTEDTVTTFQGYPRAVPMPVDYTWLLEEENSILRRKVDELKKQVSDLAATNEVLLEQNARYRSCKATTVNVVAPPIVTVSQVVTPTITPAPILSRAPLPRHPQPITGLATPLTVNSELVVSQTVPPVSVAINPVTQNMVPVSMIDTSIVPPPGSIAAVSLPNIGQPPPVTLAQATPPGPSARTICIGSNPSTALVSYPIMSHCVAQLPTTSLG